MTTERFIAATQYDNYTGTAAAETQGFSEFLKSKNLILENEFIIGIDFSPVESNSKGKKEIFLQIYLVKDFNYENYRENTKFETILDVRKVETYLDIVQFFDLFKRFNVSISWQALLENKELRIIN
ncbi:hypothetical protein [Acinetobacter baumannii]|uniref:hypothetical protein n=1 Tax=Acinetobacter baumannii TaxID=470 RepID=UPI0003043CEF